MTGTTSTDVAAEAWPAPPRPENPAGQPRRIGIELEFGGLSALETSRVVERLLGGRARVDNPHRIVVEDTEIGEVLVELDFKYAHKGPPDDPLRETLASLGATVLPMEVVLPPVTFAEAPRIDELARALAGAGAEGTFASPLYAFGAQLNPELPSVEPDYILASLRAFVLLRDWLREEIAIDPARKLWFFAAPFPKDYVRLILDAGYAPGLPRLIDDYLAHNPTRNREVDMLPLFAHLDEARVRAVLPHETIKARPTWHYRLPNASIDESGWSLRAEWLRWRRVEQLADAPARLAQGMRDWLEEDARIFGDGWRAPSRRLAESL